MTISLPTVPDPDPPHGYEGIEIPSLWRKFTPSGVAWFRNVRIPLHKEDAVFSSYKKDKRAWLARGFSMTRTDGVWGFNQWLAGVPGAFTLTGTGAEIVAAHDAANKPAQVEIPLPAAELVYPELPDGMAGKLMPHQIQPARQLLRALQQGREEWGYSGALDMSDMGSGKTYQTLAACLATGRSVGVICPPAGRKGWLAAFHHFGAEPEFLQTYEAVRGGFRPHIAARDATGQFRWKNPESLILILDEAQSCFPYGEMVATEHGLIPIGFIVEAKLNINVYSFDAAKGECRLMPVTNWFRNSPGRLVKIHHETGAITCTPSHKIWTENKGWTPAEELSKGDVLRVLRHGIHGQRFSSEILRASVQRQGSRSKISGVYGRVRSKDGEIQESTKGSTNTDLPPMQRHIPGVELQKTTLLLPGMHDSAGSDTRPLQPPVTRGQGQVLGAHDGQQPDAKPSSPRENDEGAARENLLGEGRERPINAPADGPVCGGGPTDGICYNDREQGQSGLPQRPKPLQGGSGGPVSETCHRSGWIDPQTEEMDLPRQEEDGDTQFSRVDCVEVLESGSRHGFIGGGANDPLYDFEVAGTHCYFAGDVLVHNCRHSDTLTVECFSAAVRQQVPIICASATLALSPLEFRFAGRIVGLHDGGQDWDRFLLRHGCSRKTVGGPWKWNEDRSTLAKIHARLFPARGCRVRLQDLGADAPETEISVLPVPCPEAERIEELYRDGEDMVNRLIRQGAPAGKIITLRRNNRLRTWQSSENALVEPVAELTRQAIKDGFSVALFLGFNESRIRMGRALNSTGGIYGGVSPKRRDWLMSEFQSDRLHCLVNNLKSGGVSLSLHDMIGDRPRKAFLFPTDNLIHLVQGTGRVARVKAVTKSEQFIPCVTGHRGQSIMERMVARLREKMLNLTTLNDGTADGPTF